MTEKRFELKGVERQFLWDNKNAGNMAHWIANKMSIVDLLNDLNDENEQLKQANERIVKDIDLALGFIRHKGYSFQDIKDYEDAKKEYEEDLANYRKGDVE